MPIFNLGSNEREVSRLAVVNAGSEDVAVTVGGTDDDGASPGAAVRPTVRAETLLIPTATELESGVGEGIDDGRAKWRVAVRADRPILVNSRIKNPTGQLTNLSTAPDSRGRAPDEIARCALRARSLLPCPRGAEGQVGFGRSDCRRLLDLGPKGGT